MSSPKPKKVMLAVDSSEFSLLALQFACQNVVGAHDTLTLAHVRPQVEEKDFFAAEPYRAEFEEAYMKDSTVLLEKLTRVAHSLLGGSVEVKSVSLSGDPSEELRKEAEREKPNLIVVGSHGKGVIKRALLGSVSRYLVHSAPCPVLVVKGPPHSHSSISTSLIPGMAQLGSIVGSAS